MTILGVPLEPLAFIPLIAYFWAALELSLTAHLFYYAWKESGSQIMRAAFLFKTSVAIMFFYLVFTRYLMFVKSPQLYDVLRGLIFLPTILVASGVRNLRENALGEKKKPKQRS